MDVLKMGPRPVVRSLVLAFFGLGLPWACSNSSAPALDARGQLDAERGVARDSSVAQDFPPDQDLAAADAPDLSADSGADSFIPFAFLLTVNQIPAEMNGSIPFTNLQGASEAFQLAVPRHGFTLDLLWQGSTADPASLEVTSSCALGSGAGSAAAGEELGPRFITTALGASYLIPEQAALPEGLCTFTARMSDGAEVRESSLTVQVVEKSFALDPFGLEDPWLLVFSLDHYTIERALDRAGEIEVSAEPLPNGIPDFEEDLRLIGLGSGAMLPAAASAVGRGETGTNAIMVRWLETEVLEAVRLLYLRNPDGTAGPESVRIRLYLEGDPGAPQLEEFAEQLLEGGETAKSFSAISVGGGDLGLPYTGLSQAGDLWNRRNEADLGPQYGAFTTSVLAMLFERISSDPAARGVFSMVFGPFIPELGQGGVALGEDPLDAVILGAGFDPAAASPAARQRYQSLVLLVDILRMMIGVLVAHEIGHGVGLVADGPPPRGLFGGEKNASFVGAGRTNHHHIDTAGFNVMAAGPGSVPGMSLDPMQYLTTPAFNPLNLAYLQGRILVLP